jgi:hypothetical protein
MLCRCKHTLCELNALLVAMSTRGLKTFDEAFARKKQVQEDFRDSCPNHDSKFLLNLDDVEERHQK